MLHESNSTGPTAHSAGPSRLARLLGRLRPVDSGERGRVAEEADVEVGEEVSKWSGHCRDVHYPHVVGGLNSSHALKSVDFFPAKDSVNFLSYENEAV